MSQPRLCHTTKYSLFVYNETNRCVLNGKGYKPRKELVDSMKAHGYWPWAPIVAVRGDGGKLKVIEGHNRLTAAMHVGVPVYYIALEPSDAVGANPLEYSITSKPWNLLDILRARAAGGDPDCAEVLVYADRTGISHGLAATILSGIVTPNMTYKAIRQGTYKVRSRDRGGVVANISATIGKYVKWGTDTTLLSALLKVLCIEEFDPARLVEKVDKYPEVLAKQRSLDDYVDLIETIYNRHVKRDILPVAHMARIVMKNRANGAWRDAG